MMDAAKLITISAFYDTHLATKFIWHGPVLFYTLQRPQSVAQHFWQTVKTAISGLRQEMHFLFASASPDRVDGGMSEANWVCSTSYVTGEARRSFYDILDSDNPLQRGWCTFYELMAEHIMAKKILLDFADWLERIIFSTLLKHRSIAHLYPAPARCKKLVPPPSNDAAAEILCIRSQFLYVGLKGYDGTNFDNIRMADFFHTRAKWFYPSRGSTSLRLTSLQTWKQPPSLTTLPDPEVQQLDTLMGAAGKAGVRSKDSRPNRAASASGKPVTNLGSLLENRLIENWFFFDLFSLFLTPGKRLFGSLMVGLNHCIESMQ